MIAITNNKLSYRERVKSVVNRKENAGIPCAYDFTSQAANKVIKYYGITGAEFADTIHEHFFYVEPGLPQGSCEDDGEQLPDGIHRDEFGVLWEWKDWMSSSMGDVGSLVKPALNEPSLTGYKFPDGALPRFNHINTEKLKDSKRFVLFNQIGLFDTCWHIRGFENFLGDMADETIFVNQLLDLAADYIIKVIKQAPDGIDGVRILEDWGLQKGMIMGPGRWRTLLKPRLKEIYAAARKRGLTVMLHSCGDIHEVMPDLIEIGMQVVHPIQPEAMDLGFIKREYGKDLVFYGGIGSQSTLVTGTSEETLAEAQNRVLVMGAGGGYIIGPAGAIPPDGKTENIVTLIEFCKTLF